MGNLAYSVVALRAYVTHHGATIYDNRIFRDKITAIAYAKRDAEAGIRLLSSDISQIEADLASRLARLAKCEVELAQVRMQFPTVA